MKHRTGRKAVTAAVAVVAPAALIVLATTSALAGPLHPAAVQTSPTYAGYIIDAGQSTASVATTFIVPTITCTATNVSITPGVGEPDNNGTNIIAAGVVAGCQNGAPFYTGEADINGVITVFKVSVTPGDKITTSLSTTASATTGTFGLTAPGAKDAAPTFLAHFKGTGGVLPFPCIGNDSEQLSTTLNPVPKFTTVTFTASKIDGKPLSAATDTRLNMATATGILQIKTSTLTSKGASFSSSFVNVG